ncbi:MAG: alpha-galactosidase [Oscillospiraceae bacterium]|nr:alpha-galactosidase [Oscillospiraceae bacterium]
MTIDLQRIPDDSFVVCDGGPAADAAIRFEPEARGLSVYLRAVSDRPKFVCLRWNFRTDVPVRVLGDQWERAYADLGWKGLDGERFLPWYFLAAFEDGVAGCGVSVRPAAFVSFEYDASGVSAWFDVRCGAAGVALGGRELCLGTVISRSYPGADPFAAACAFCRELCPDPLLPKFPVYGGNNWYYAYGRSSAPEILGDTELVAALAEGLSNRPFMVIDDGWEVNSVAGPWRPNERFGDMRALADAIRAKGVRPGIWIRPLHDPEYAAAHPDHLLRGEFLDPTVPEAAEHVRRTVEQVRDWGYELIKHDFTTFDLFGEYGNVLNGVISIWPGWTFHDQTRTGAEIVLDLYRLIRAAAGDAVVIGCNTVSHLAAGLVEVNRVGDDTSGTDWNRTRAMGVNTLAFRLPQNRAFYMADADCVGVIPGRLDWSLNGQWAELLSRSGTPLFLSCPRGGLTPDQFEEMRRAFAFASRQTDVAVPLDWTWNAEPQDWLINGEKKSFDFVGASVPRLLFRRYLGGESVGRD